MAEARALDPGDVATDGAESRRAQLRALVSWVLFDWAAQPFYTLILTFLFAPYFANVVVGNTERGTTLWGYAAAVGGVVVAIGSPLLGALADGRGRRKPWIGLFSVLLAIAVASLWVATPGASSGIVILVLAAFVLAIAAAEFTTVFTNAIMPSLVPPRQLGRLSGIGWGAGYTGGLVSLAIVAGLLADTGNGKTLLGLTPLVPFDASTPHAGDRVVGPFVALWFLLFMVPFFLFVPDAPTKTGQEPRRPALAELWDTIRSLPAHRDMLLFLIARMLYSDGLSAIFAFGGIYGAAIFGWGPSELAVFGIILIVTGIAGAVLGGILDDQRGAKAVIIGALFLLLVGAVGILSVDRNHVLFAVEVAPKAAGSKLFSSAGEWVFLGFALLVGVVAAPVQAASRSLLARLAPRDKVTQFFGLFAFSGKVTAFLAPFMVATVTAATNSQRAGMASIALFLIAGMILMLPVRARQ